MARTRLQLQSELEKICSKCYYSPPNGFNLSYPCIIYQLQGNFTQHADNIGYFNARRYNVTIIDEDPDTSLPEKFESIFKYRTLNRVFYSDNLIHFVYELYW